MTLWSLSRVCYCDALKWKSLNEQIELQKDEGWFGNNQGPLKKVAVGVSVQSLLSKAKVFNIMACQTSFCKFPLSTTTNIVHVHWHVNQSKLYYAYIQVQSLKIVRQVNYICTSAAPTGLNRFWCCNLQTMSQNNLCRCTVWTQRYLRFGFDVIHVDFALKLHYVSSCHSSDVHLNEFHSPLLVNNVNMNIFGHYRACSVTRKCFCCW